MPYVIKCELMTKLNKQALAMIYESRIKLKCANEGKRTF